MQTTKYPLTIRLLHWLMAIAILGMIFSGWYMAQLPDDAANKSTLYPWQQSFGALLIFALAARIVIRLIAQFTGKIPAAPGVLASWEKLASHMAHAGLYVLMLAVPASGYIMFSAFPHSKGIDFFGSKLPDIVAKDQAVTELYHSFHGPIAYALLALISLHIGAVIKHKYMDDQEADVLPRMLK